MTTFAPLPVPLSPVGLLSSSRSGEFLSDEVLEVGVGAEADLRQLVARQGRLGHRVVVVEARHGDEEMPVGHHANRVFRAADLLQEGPAGGEEGDPVEGVADLVLVFLQRMLVFGDHAIERRLAQAVLEFDVRVRETAVVGGVGTEHVEPVGHRIVGQEELGILGVVRLRRRPGQAAALGQGRVFADILDELLVSPTHCRAIASHRLGEARRLGRGGPAAHRWCSLFCRRDFPIFGRAVGTGPREIWHILGPWTQTA